MKSQGPGLTLLCGASLSGPICLSLQTRWGGWGKQWVTAVPFSGGGSSGQATEGFCPYTTSRKERLIHGYRRGPPSQGPSLILPKGMYKQWLEVFLDSLGASSLAPQKMGSSLRKVGSKVPQRAWPSW